MTLFSSDLYRNFALGFVAGTLVVGVATFDQWAGEIESAAQAAAPLKAPAPANEFLIEPLADGE